MKKAWTRLLSAILTVVLLLQIFGHMFVADCILPLSLFSGILQRSKQGEKWDIYGRVSEPDIDKDESRLQWFYRIEAIFG